MPTKLNRVLLASGLAITSAAMLSPAVFAAPTAPNTLSGTVAQVLDIAWINPDLEFAIPPAGVSNQKIGDITTSSNVATYRIFATSGNNGVLSDGATPAKTVTYDISLNGATPVLPDNTGAVVLLNQTSGLSLPAQPLTLNTVANVLPAGTYTDLLTLTIATP